MVSLKCSASKRISGWSFELASQCLFLSAAFWWILLLVVPGGCHAASPVLSYFGILNDDVTQHSLVSPIVNREIQVSVQAPWPSSSEHNVLCEAFCFVRDHAFLDALATFQGQDQLVTYERATNYALELAEQASLDTRLLQVALTMRAMAPTCELHRSLVRDFYAEYADYLEAFVVVADGAGEGTVLQTSADLPESIIDLPMLTTAERKAWMLPNEVIRKGATTIAIDDEDESASSNGEQETCSSTGLVILYARLGGHSFATFYRRLVELEIPFVVRHMGSDPSEDHEQPYTALQGFGVRLDIRNVEYKVFDDKKDVDESTQASMINLTSLDGASPGHLSTQFLAGVNLTAISFSDGLGDTSSLYDLQRKLWKLHEGHELHNGRIPPNWQRRKLSLQAATVVAHSKHPLLTLQDVSQNLPSVASTLVHVKVPEEIKTVAEPMERNLQRLMRSSGGGLWINGRVMNVERPSFNVFEMIKLLKEESGTLTKLEKTIKPLLKQDTAMDGLKAIQQVWIENAIDKDTTDSIDKMEGEEDDEEGSEGSRKGQYRIDLATGDEAVIYMNDVEKDRGYSRLTSSVQQMLMAMQYGMPPAVRRNLFTILVVEGPMSNDEESQQNFGEILIGQLAQQQFPARLAVVVASQEDIDACSEWIRAGKAKDSQACPVDKNAWLTKEDPPSDADLKALKVTARDFHRMYAYMRHAFADQSEVLIAYKMYLEPSLQQDPPSNGEFYSVYDLLAVHSELLLGLRLAQFKLPVQEIARALQENEEDSKLSYANAIRFAVDKGLKPGMSFLNGRPLPTNEDDAEQLQTIFTEEQQLVFGMIMEQKITDEKPRNFYYNLIKGKKKNVFPRVHPLLTSSGDDFVELSHGMGVDSLLAPQTMNDANVAAASEAIFLFEAVLELDSPVGLAYAQSFLKLMNSASSIVDGSETVVKYRILPSTTAAAKSALCQMLGSARKIGYEKALNIVDKLVEDPNSMVDLAGCQIDSTSCSNLLYLQNELPSRNFITANGRVYSMDGEPLDAVDIDLLMNINLDSTKFVTNLLKSHLDNDLAYDAVGATTAFLKTSKGVTKARSDPGKMFDALEEHFEIKDNPLRFSWNTDASRDDSLRMTVTAIVDPVTETAQRLSPLLIVIRDDLKLPLNLLLAPSMQVDNDSKIPISSYYRFVANPSAYQGSERSPKAHFANLPTDHVLTLRMDVPEPWDVQQTSAVQDTDNLRCDVNAGCGDQSQSGIDVLQRQHVTRVQYGLEHLLFFGQCYDTRMSPPNGLQLVLDRPGAAKSIKNGPLSTEIGADGSIQILEPGSSGLSAVDTHYSDTLVMKTVGYWQLRANPGVWNLKINEKSRGAEIFQMVDGKVKQGMLRVTGKIPNNAKRIVMSDFVGGGHTLLVKRKPGYEKASLFYDDKKNDTDDDDVLHVFSLATGHLYERFLKIMMLSVTKRTSTKVKFWLFENFLSPSFKETSRAMAKRIGCEVEFVTYKWPEWLRGQSEKQRIIWGYKILFLDVLFPLSVKKIIYVDADQVIRGDLKELRDMDLQGAPYGYTPMCSSNEETLGFQFWRQGFWATHLHGKPYHISALYVVDLEKFRKDRVGDTLRAQYQALSADPGSLANLDQDLPNYAQHQVPIFSLPQEWLWCESWCSLETKPDAKTIDLCNNPLHKEPKVSMAKRIISGDLFEESWIELDSEVEQYEKEYLESLPASNRSAAHS
jgi:hypothetical protein